MRVRHGMCGTRTYKTWEMMIQRCTNPKFDGFHRYGGRGITVCEEWKDFVNFFTDMGERPEGMTLDRVDVDRGYYRENCKWSNQTEQMYNKRPSRVDTRTGVHFHKGANKWAASIQYRNKSYHLGLFEKYEDAVSSREQAELKFYGKIRSEGICEVADTEDAS